MVRAVLLLVLAASVHPLLFEEPDAFQSSFVLGFKKVVAEPGEYVRVPLMLSNSTDSIGGWNVLVKYDTSAGRITAVELCDSVWVEDSVWVHAPWVRNPDLSRPEYFEYTLSIQGHQDWVRVVGIMDMPDSAAVPGLPPGEEQMLLCFAYDVSPSWDGEDVGFNFQTNVCGDNILSDLSGYVVWGPDTLSAPWATCPQRPNGLRSIRLNGGVGIAAATAISSSTGLGPSVSFNVVGYPNPFSLSTTIHFTLPEDGYVDVRIYSIAGELVKTLEHSVMQKGQHRVIWNGENASSGVYFCQVELTTESDGIHRTTEKMTLLR